jgi:hypothetical protein
VLTPHDRGQICELVLVPSHKDIFLVVTRVDINVKHPPLYFSHQPTKLLDKLLNKGIKYGLKQMSNSIWEVKLSNVKEMSSIE